MSHKDQIVIELATKEFAQTIERVKEHIGDELDEEEIIETMDGIFKSALARVFGGEF